jgi:hypothetical protein
MDANSFYPRLFEKFTEVSDPVKDMGIGMTDAEVLLHAAIEIAGDQVMVSKEEEDILHSLPLGYNGWNKLRNAMGWKRVPKKYIEQERDPFNRWVKINTLSYKTVFKEVYGGDWYYDDVDLVQEDRTIVNMFKHFGIKFKDLVKLVEKSPNLKRKKRR